MKRLNRGWVKNAAIIFLVVMLALTFLSNTIMNFTLVEVETAQPISRSIVNAIRENAMAEAMGSYQIEVEQPRHILAVFVREGEQVFQGARLFELEEGEDELRDQLETLQRQYEQMLLEMAGSDHAMQNETVRQAREDLQRANSDRAALGTAPISLALAQLRVSETTAAYDSENGRLSNLETELGYVDDLDSRSTRIGPQVIAYERALADFIRDMGMPYDVFIALYPEATDLPVIAVQNARLAAQTAAANARVALVAEINSQAALVRAAQAAKTEAENVLARVAAIDAADERVRTAQRTLNAALISLSEQQQTDSVAEAQRRLELAAMEEDIAELEARIRAREGDYEGEGAFIVARHDGIITGLTAVAGQTAEPGIPLARIEVAQMGYVAEISVGTQLAQQVRPGAAVDVSRFGWFADVSGRVTGIRPDPADTANRRIISVELTGDVMAGEQLNLSVHLSSGNYETVLPRSAVNRDAGGDHIYVLHQRRSPLGDRYMAVRQDVTVLAEDETWVAISGVDRFSSIIIRSSGTISDRDFVRLATD